MTQPETPIVDGSLAAEVARLERQVAALAARERHAMHLATHDPLTGAPNRLAFQHALAERVRRAGPFACAMLDLDRFKLINDTLGHLAGDAVIREVCAILHAAAPADALIARLGGDEFGILFPTPDEHAAATACDRMVAACCTELTVFGHRVQGGASAGLVVGEGGRDPLDVLRRADLALNAAKRAGRGGTRLFDRGMEEELRARRRIEHGLAAAIGRGELSLVFQPIVTRGTIAIDGFEALLRWDGADGGPIGPATFIPIAEESNLIHELGDWVLAAALDELAHWPGQYVSINVSPRQFRRHDFAATAIERVSRAGIEPGRVQIEITEAAIAGDAERAADTLAQLRRAGLRIALDDFGTGGASLHDVGRLALDGLKIDRALIEGMGRERESAAIVHSIIQLGRSLGLGIVAKGVETQAQAQALRLAGASHLQGRFFSHPVPAGQARLLATQGLMYEEDEPATGTHG